MKMVKHPFNTFVYDVTARYTKIKSSLYIEKGEFPIVDQGDNFIAGYTNNKSLIAKTQHPVVVFGDHTRNLKYVDFDFAIGADGVKVLETVYEKVHPKYFYYFLKSLRILNAGYSRHFKYLKRNKIVIPEEFEDQIRIAKVLTKAEDLIAKRKESIQLLDELIKSTFLDMFGDPVKNEKGWPTEKLFKLTDKIGSGSTPRGGKETYKTVGIFLIRSLNVYDNLFKYKDLALIDEKQAKKLNNVIVKPNDVLLNITGASVCRCTVVPDNLIPARVNQHVAILRSKSEVLNSQFLCHLLISQNYKKYLVNIATQAGATRQALTKEQLEKLEIPTPPINNQIQFTKIIEKIESIKLEYQTSLTELENLYGSLSQRAFKGELDLSGIEVEEINTTFTNVVDETENQILLEKTTEQEKITKLNKYYSDYFNSLPDSGAKKDIDGKLRQLDQELKIRGEIPYWEEYVKYRIIKHSLKGKFNFTKLQKYINEFPFEENVSFVTLKNLITELLEGENPFLSQNYNEEKKEIFFSVNK